MINVRHIITEATATTVEGGRATGSGSVHFRGFLPETFDLKLANKMLDQLGRETVLELAQRPRVHLREAAARGVVQGCAAHLVEQLLDHRADPHDLRGLADEHLSDVGGLGVRAGRGRPVLGAGLVAHAGHCPPRARPRVGRSRPLAWSRAGPGVRAAHGRRAMTWLTTAAHGRWLEARAFLDAILLAQVFGQLQAPRRVQQLDLRGRPASATLPLPCQRPRIRPPPSRVRPPRSEPVSPSSVQPAASSPIKTP